jgi:hypothetical protein
MKSIFFVGLFLVSFCIALPAQNFNKIEFIEPNVSIHYDSLQFKVRGKFAHHLYAKEFIYFDVLTREKLKITIKLAPNNPIKNINALFQKDSLVLAYKEKLINTKGEDIQLTYIDTGIVRIHDFSCYGFIFTNTKEPEVYHAIHGIHATADNFTQVDYYGLNEKDLASCYKNLTRFLAGFKSYSALEITTMEQAIKNKYTVKVDSIANPKLKPFHFTYTGKISIREKLQHKLLAIHINAPNGNGIQIFKPNKLNQTFIAIQDKEKGRLTKEGVAIFLNELNKVIAVPFTFSYFNK